MTDKTIWLNNIEWSKDELRNELDYYEEEFRDAVIKQNLFLIEFYSACRKKAKKGLREFGIYIQ